MKKDIVKAIIAVILIVAISIGLANVFGDDDVQMLNGSGVAADEAVVRYKYVNLRSTPDVDSETNIIGQLNFGDVVKVLDEKRENDFIKVKSNLGTGYVIYKSICDAIIMFDISDFNWGSEYSSIEEFKTFTKTAIANTKFGGYYIQVQRTFYENKHWSEITEALDEMEVPYGVYLYSNANTIDGAKAEYENFKKLIKKADLKYCKFPFMVDLEKNTDQSKVLEYYNSVLNDYIVYSGAAKLVNYGYYKEAPCYWVAHYGVENALPYQSYTEYGDAFKKLTDAKLWQFTEDGNQALFGTKHLDVNIVSKDWYQKYN